MKLALNTLADTKKLAKQIIKIAEQSKNNQSAVLGLVGPLGAGKTTLVQYLAKELGVKQIVNSPTFVLMKEYLIKGGLASLRSRSGWKKLIH
ncbi:MAG: tRNA (adenosine(37)-N6)-threonylcarbamoyltransferase complex ATPase subunit type 1 TsaE, partial [Candidatus Komeilibacteria bacterium]|nr:tRNA (adenosine(37)-N6)-threonylcarbamoyltransferase complex ATPase subunit type 1 TsaE [Candidatus Komeilibacteria bacterium]